MSHRQLKDHSNVEIDQITTFIKNFSSFELEERDNNFFICISRNVNGKDILELLDFLWEKQFEIAFHDTIHPTFSDPGAYFSYSFQKSLSKNVWSMTYGNHGWSGGIYHIERTTLARQMENLIQKSEMDGIQITGVVFFDHYPLKSELESKKKDSEINDMHRID